MKTLFALALAFSLSASGQLIQSFSGGDDLNVGPGTAGYDFTIGASSYTVNSLGIWDASGTGLTAEHTVGIWNAASRVLLASVVVTPAGNTDQNGFKYMSITPVLLQSGTTYRLGATYADVDFDLARGNATAVTAPRGTLGDAFLSTGSGFEFPDVNVSGANKGFFGPNASFIAVPEPIQTAVVSGCLLVCFVVGRRLISLLDRLARQ